MSGPLADVTSTPARGRILRAALWGPALVSLVVGAAAPLWRPDPRTRQHDAEARTWIEDCSACAALLVPFEVVAFTLDPAAVRADVEHFELVRYVQGRYAFAPVRLRRAGELEPGSFRHHLVVMPDDDAASARAALLGGTILWRNTRGAALVRLDG